MNRRSRTPKTCTCPQARHKHGTAASYKSCGCGCDACYLAYTGTPRSSVSDQVTTRGQFVACWPYFGGMSRQRVARVIRPEMVALAEAQGVQLIPGDPQIRLVRTGAGAFVVAQQPAVSYQPVAAIRARAAEFAWEHEQAIPDLSRWITRHLEEAA